MLTLHDAGGRLGVVSERPRFHVAFAVDDLVAARRFYGGVLGCTEGRSSEHWVDFDLYGHQLVAHRVEELVDEPVGERARRTTNPVDGDDVPVPHFGHERIGRSAPFHSAHVLRT